MWQLWTLHASTVKALALPSGNPTTGCVTLLAELGLFPGAVLAPDLVALARAATLSASDTLAPTSWASVAQAIASPQHSANLVGTLLEGMYHCPAVSLPPRLLDIAIVEASHVTGCRFSWAARRALWLLHPPAFQTYICAAIAFVQGLPDAPFTQLQQHFFQLPGLCLEQPLFYYALMDNLIGMEQSEGMRRFARTFFLACPPASGYAAEVLASYWPSSLQPVFLSAMACISQQQLSISQHIWYSMSATQ